VAIKKERGGLPRRHPEPLFEDEGERLGREIVHALGEIHDREEESETPRLRRLEGMSR